MSIGTCPTSGQACNFVPAFHEVDTEMPAFVELCADAEKVNEQNLTHHQYCGRYKHLARVMIAQNQEGAI